MFDEGKRYFSGRGGVPQSYDHAFFCFSEAISSQPQNPEIFCWRGRTLMALGKFPEAIYDFTWAVRLTETAGKDGPDHLKKLSEYHRFAG